MNEPAKDYVGHRILEAMRSAPHYADAIFRHVSRLAVPGMAILDFGAGDGVFAEKFLASGMPLDCVEPDPANQEILKRGAMVLTGLSECTKRYDFIYAINVLEHLDPLENYVTELYSALKPGGLLFVFVPAFNLLWTSLDDEVGHIRRFTKRSLTEFLARAGFTVERSHYFDSAGFPAALTVRVMEKLNLFRYSSSTVGFYDKAILPISLFGDQFLSGFLGKNVIAVARRPPRAQSHAYQAGT